MNNKKLHRNQKALLLFFFIVIPVITCLIYLDSRPDDWDWGKWTVKPTLKVQVVKRTAEVPLCEGGLFEARNGPVYYNLVTASVFLKSVPDKHKSLEKKALENSAQIKSIIREIVGSAGTRNIEDPELKYVKGEISQQVGKVVGNELFSDVLIPQWEVDYPPFSTPRIAPR